MRNKFLELKSGGFYPKKILDIGSNVGEFTEMCKNIWDKTEYYLVEANLECEKYLSKINCKYYMEVLGEEDNKEVSFYLTKENEICTGNSTYLEKTKHYSSDNLIVEKRKTKKLTTLFDKEEFDLIKIDTQGSELDILKGGIDKVKKATYVVIETSIKEYNENAPLEPEIINFMKAHGFLIFVELTTHVWPTKDGLFKEGEVFQRDLMFINDIKK
jgi:FkbM family methyltransferase